MAKLYTGICIVGCVLSWGCASTPPAQVLFDGRDLGRWESAGSARWRAVEGVIVGGQDGDPQRSGVLMTREKFRDFELELEFMIDEHGKYNSGVYLRYDPNDRRRRRYQINLGRGAAGEFVGLYLNEWLDKGDETDEIRKPLAWNRLRIRAVGPHVQAWLNGRQIVDHVHADPAPYLLEPGRIAFQTYGAEGHAGWVKFRNITVRELNSESR